MNGGRGGNDMRGLPGAGGPGETVNPRNPGRQASAGTGASAIVLTIAVAVFCMPVAFPVPAVEPHEILEDPVLESRAREISRKLRCLVCRNENIDSSNAELAADLRVLVRERLAAGDDDEEVLEYLVDRYGEYVLLYPRVTGANLLLWAAGPLALLAGTAFLVRRKLRRSVPDDRDTLGGEEERRVAELIGD